MGSKEGKKNVFFNTQEQKTKHKYKKRKKEIKRKEYWIALVIIYSQQNSKHFTQK